MFVPFRAQKLANFQENRLRVYFLFDLLGQVNVIEGVRAGDHRGAEVGLVDALLAVLIVEPHVVPLERLWGKTS